MLMNMNSQIRQAAKQAIETSGLTQQELAKKAGMRQATVSRLLTGERRGEPETWERLLSELGLELMAVPKGTDLSRLLKYQKEG